MKIVSQGQSNENGDLEEWEQECLFLLNKDLLRNQEGNFNFK
jgi:hypothetical protein